MPDPHGSIDPGLYDFATPRQREIFEAVDETGSFRAAARKLGIDNAAVCRAHQVVIVKAARQGYAPDYDMTRSVPDGFRLRGTSTLYDEKTGRARLQWVKSEIDKDRQQELFREAVAAFAATLPRAEPAPAAHAPNDALMAAYPVGDHHLGMLAWGEEAGDDYDLGIGTSLLKRATDHLVGITPPSGLGLIVFLGDFLHYDGFEAVTPTNRNQLSSDSRFPKMVRSGLLTMRYMVDCALKHHERVHVVVEIGNHDLASSIFLMECLANIYEREPRVTVDTSPRHYHYVEFGRNLIGTHHGHGSKMPDLPLIMATDRPEAWGRTQYRYWWTGHVHHDQAKDYNGCRVESFRILPPTDAWAANNGYRSARDMKAIVFHREYGEVARHIVNPDMLADAEAA